MRAAAPASEVPRSPLKDPGSTFASMLGAAGQDGKHQLVSARADCAAQAERDGENAGWRERVDVLDDARR